MKCNFLYILKIFLSHEIFEFVSQFKNFHNFCHKLATNYFVPINFHSERTMRHYDAVVSNLPVIHWENISIKNSHHIKMEKFAPIRIRNLNFPFLYFIHMCSIGVYARKT
jgi:hypothetical protein